eukprot:CAMPEP_0170176842 /NCGR_PEP_ID=MMETSP0040_2-20121228/9621_1 /TAXON_ID=641309 /ORGANISM="Lotharella oceanica, Strain CCMP622" /LENGTH=133 /DNA_ID=CAMNT_0010419287 /DNA_START=51 /DNA_END=452 /DNA_ORIENTATION=+
MLATHHDVQDKARDEVQKVFKANDGEISADVVLNQLPHLSAVVKETLRLFPPVGVAMPRVTTTAMTLGPLRVPAKTPLMVVGWVAMRSEKTWGEDAKMFRPERFLKGSLGPAGDDVRAMASSVSVFDPLPDGR